MPYLKSNIFYNGQVRIQLSPRCIQCKLVYYCILYIMGNCDHIIVNLYFFDLNCVKKNKANPLGPMGDKTTCVSFWLCNHIEIKSFSHTVSKHSECIHHRILFLRNKAISTKWIYNKIDTQEDSSKSKKNNQENVSKSFKIVVGCTQIESRTNWSSDC